MSSLKLADTHLLEADAQLAEDHSSRGTRPTATVINMSAERAQHLIAELHEAVSTGGDYDSLAAKGL